MDAKIFRVNYKSDFILTLTSDAGWMTPFCIKFWTGSPMLAYYASYDGETHVHCTYDPSEPTKLTVQFDDHHLPIGNLKYQVAYHFTVADFPENTEDEVTNQANVTTVIDGDTYQVMLDLNGETAPEIQFALPAYANELQRIQNEQTRIAQEQQRIAQEQQRISQEAARVTEFNGIKAEALADHQRANEDHSRATSDHQNALADRSQAASDHSRAQSDHTTAGSDHSQANSDHIRAQSDHNTAISDHQTALSDHTQANTDHTRAESDHSRATADSSTAAADHRTASTDHTQANTDHTRAESDHQRVETDLAEVEEFSNSLGAYDISAAHATGSTLATYPDLATALGTNGSNIPEALRKGGMSVKFVLTYDNKYVQYRLMADSFSITEADWQGVDAEPTAGSKNLVTSGGVYKIKEELHSYGTVKVSNVISDTYGHKLFDCNIPAGQAIYLKPLLENNDITNFIVYVNGTNSGKYRILKLINTSRNGWFVATLDETVTSIWAVCHFSGNNSYRLCYSLDSDIARIDNTVNEMHIKDIEVLSPNKIHIDKKGSDSFDYVMPDITQLNDIYSEYCDHNTSFSAFNTLNISTGKKFKLKIEGTASLTRLIFFINGHNDGDDRILDTRSPVIGKWYEFTATKNITSITVATWGTVTSYRVVLHNNNILDELDNNIIISDEFTDQWGHTAFNELTVNKGDTLRFKVIGDATLTKFILYANGINQSDYRLYNDALSLDTWVEVTAGFDITSLSCVVNQGTVTSYQVVLDLGNNVDLTKVKDIFIEGSNLNITKKSGERLIYNPEGSNVLYGKKWAVCGDSFTYGDFSNALEQESEYKFSDGPYSGKYKTYNRLIALRNNMTLQIIARGGRTMATPSVISLHNCFSDLDTLDFGGNYQSIDSDVDYITLYFGINDSHNRPSGSGGDGEQQVGEIPIGDVNDNTINTYCGAYNVVLDWLITNRPFAHIGVIISNGCDTDEYRTKTITICEKHGIPYIDMNGDNHTPVMLRSTNPEISASVKAARLQSQSVNPSLNLHPNAKAHNYESYFIEEFLRSI